MITPFLFFFFLSAGAAQRYKGSGVHITTRGGHLKVHADFNRLKFNESDHRPMQRRVNVFLYLNKDWPVEIDITPRSNRESARER